MSEFELIQEIVERSEADPWYQANGEWEPVAVYYTKNAVNCICGKLNIRRICVLQNTLNGEHVIVGSKCVKKFCDLPWKAVIDGMNRLRKARERAMSYLTLVYARSYDWINRREFEAYAKTIRKRRLSPREAEHRREINHRVLEAIRESEAYWNRHFDRLKSEDAAAEQVAQ